MMFRCSLCPSTCDATAKIWRCPCGAPLNLDFPVKLDVEAARREPRGVWRGAGAGGRVHFKRECASPTGSFKDRGVAVLASWLNSQGVTRVTEDSSGNAGASLAAYCARAGIACNLYTPEAASPGKLLQAQASGARVIAVPGPRDG